MAKKEATPNMVEQFAEFKELKNKYRQDDNDQRARRVVPQCIGKNVWH